MTDLAVQKRLLVVESAANRLALANELQRLTAPLGWLNRMTSKKRPLLYLLAPLGGYLATRKLPEVMRWSSRALRVFRVFKVLKPLLRRRS